MLFHCLSFTYLPWCSMNDHGGGSLSVAKSLKPMKIHLKNTFKSLILWQFWPSVGQIGILLSWFCPLGLKTQGERADSTVCWGRLKSKNHINFARCYVVYVTLNATIGGEKKTTTRTICSSEIIVRFLFVSISSVYFILLFFQTQNDMLVYFLPVYSKIN